MMRCSQCGREFTDAEQVACISGRIFGDECTDCYYWCEACGVYSLRMYRDVFAGPELEKDCEPISKTEGDRRIELIHRCPNPGDERCRCEAHREYFGEWLD
ncbi:hypothetical protein EZJ19_15110 [Parasulfuritortus cantonensis]|uniref:Uncharacterized protein n=1 Tax=Parasulfuritortus cantonensis TaxID=2528202 RepID=A0A4R1B1E9_9PROT|nr:hypothetical protein [Parasulfuritortus cantonensis]TCJ11601.1 hypothetical protein EZJ19_15110 [Parasulfuritortus cantonensis]